MTGGVRHGIAGRGRGRARDQPLPVVLLGEVMHACAEQVGQRDDADDLPAGGTGHRGAGQAGFGEEVNDLAEGLVRADGQLAGTRRPCEMAGPPRPRSVRLVPAGW